MTTIIYSPLPFLLLIAALIIRSRYNRVGFSNVLTYGLLLGAFVAALIVTLIVTITQPPFLLPSPFIGYAWMPPYPFIFILAFGKKNKEIET